MQRDLIKPLNLPYQDSSARVNSHPHQSSSATSRMINTDTKPAAFMLSSNVQDNYSAYRLNSNMGLSSTPDASKSKFRTGFFGEMYSNPQDQRSHDNFNRQQHMYAPPQSAGKSPFYQNGASVVASANWSNPYPNYTENQMYNQQYGMKPSHFSQQSNIPNSPYNYQKYPDPHQNMLLSPVYMKPSPMYYPRRQQSVSHYRPQSDDDGFAKVERLFMVQTKHLESLIRNYDRNDSSMIHGGDQPNLLKGLNDPSRNPGSRKNSGVPHYPKILNDVHASPVHSHGHPEPHQTPSRTSPVDDHANNKPDEIKDVEPGSPKEDGEEKGGKKKKKDKKKDKKEPGLKLRYALWAIVYPHLLNKVVEKQVEEKKKSGQGNSENIKGLNGQVIEFIKKHCSAPLEALYKDGKSMVVIAEGKKISDKDLAKMFTAMTDRLVAIMEALNKSITAENLPSTFIEFFCRISKNFAVLPQKFLSEYEIFCMEFSHYGTVKNMNPFKIKMLVGLYVLVKSLIYTFLTQPWTVFPKHKKSANFSKKLKNCSSVLYHVVMDYFKENLQAVKSNQASLPVEKRLKPTKDPLVSFVDSADAIQALQSAGPLEVIHGLYNREGLIECYTSQRDSVAKIKTLVEECLEKLCTLVQDAQAQDKKQ